MQRTSSGQLRVKLLFLFATFALCGLSLVSYIRLQNLINASESVKQTQYVKLELNQAYENLLEAESIQRAYIITHDSSLLTTYANAIQHLGWHFNKVAALTKNNPAQQEIISRLNALIHKRKLYLDDNIEAAVHSRLSPSRIIEGKIMMDEVRSLVNKMEVEEDKKLIGRSEVYNKESVVTPFFIIILILAAIILIIASYLKIISELKISDTLRIAVEDREIQLQNLFSAAPDAIITINEQGIITTWNTEAKNMFGWTKEEILGSTLTQNIIPERFANLLDTGMNRFIRTGESTIMNKPLEIFARRKNGTEFPVELKISVSHLPDQPPLFIGFVRDISRRKQIEEKLINETNQLIEAQQLAHIGSWEWDVVNNKLEWSDELFRIYGFQPQQFEASFDNFLNLIHPEDKAHVDKIVKTAFENQLPFYFIHRIVRPDGSVRVLSATGKVFTDKQGNTIRMAGTGQDITLQKEFEDALKKSEERFFKIFDSNPVAMTLAEIKTNKIRYANNLFCVLFGYSKEEVIGSTSEELNLVSPEENERLITVLLEYLQEKRTVEELRALSVEETEKLLKKLKLVEAMKDFEVLYTRKNGETFPALVSFEIIAINEERYTITSYLDITERKKTELLLKKQNQELESFTYISSHDLQEPLRQIQTFASRITDKETDNLSETGKNYFRRIQTAADRMQTLIADLLAYSRTQVSSKKFELVPLHQLVEQVLSDLKEIITEKNAVIKLGEMCDAWVIPFQFSQMIHNLIGNSLKFARPGIPPIISISCKKIKYSRIYETESPTGQDFYHIRIADNGIGFEPEYNKRIFEVFQRLHDKEKYPGTGIGLAIVKKIVENHQGLIKSTSQLNEGAVFDIYIPCNINSEIAGNSFIPGEN